MTIHFFYPRGCWKKTTKENMRLVLQQILVNNKTDSLHYRPKFRNAVHSMRKDIADAEWVLLIHSIMVAVTYLLRMWHRTQTAKDSTWSNFLSKWAIIFCAPPVDSRPSLRMTTNLTVTPTDVKFRKCHKHRRVVSEQVRNTPHPSPQ